MAREAEKRERPTSSQVPGPAVTELSRSSVLLEGTT